ncbi:hypothetical protein HW555_004969 [Spodoptera exigua]|uniref:C2H2-type domain-containing protein n=1 Tax=Spodoptera exigua TaxID=7107 RepID=A0A835GJC2_SPOEX|nr:hypothetical protein HW555_004969 [Spodoptera exigua]
MPLAKLVLKMEDKMHICSACLSTGRHLISLHNISDILEEISLLELKNSLHKVCWECWCIIKKFYKFKKKVRIAQNTLLQSKKKTKFKSLSTLTVTTNLNYNFEYIYNDDFLINNLQEQSSIKKEVHHQTDRNSHKTLGIDENIQNTKKSIENTHTDEFETKDNIASIKHFYESHLEPIVANDIDYKEEVLIENIYVETLDLKPDTKTLRESKRNHHNFKKIPFKCEMCVLGFTREENYNLHMQKKHAESIGAYQCDVCKIRFSTKLAANKHKRKHYVCYRCRCCRYKAHELWSALNHCRTKHLSDEPDKIHCSQCEVIVKTPQELEDHIQDVHSLHCNECGVKFKASSTLRRHMARIHSVIRDFICDICSKTFKTKTRLESHMVKHNASIAKKLAYCHTCDVQYKNIYVYRNHLKSSANHTERAYSCPECSKKFASKVYWTNHYNFYHLQKSQYKCDICNKRSYMCEDCGHTFKQRAALYTHTRLLHRQT